MQARFNRAVSTGMLFIHTYYKENKSMGVSQIKRALRDIL